MIFVRVLGVIFCMLVPSAIAQDDGQYRVSTTRRPYYLSPVTTRRPNYRNSGGSDGRYIPGNEGRYTANDGRYIPSNEGKYIHQDVPYQPGGGQYTGGGGEYKGNRDTTTRQTPTPRPTTYKPTVSIIPYTYTTTTVAPRPTIKGSGTGEGGGGWKIIRWDKDEPEDGYHYLYETENGILAEESGRVEGTGEEDGGIKASGFYEYTGDDGNLYRVEYSADENGFKPKGDHILPVPDSVRRTLEWLQAHGELDR